MDTQLLLTVTTVFTGTAAVALTVAMIAAIGIWRSVNALRRRAVRFMDEWEPVAKSSQETLVELQRQSNQVLTTVGELAETARSFTETARGFSETAQRNAARVDETVRKTMDRVDNATAAVEQAIRAPADQFKALGAGLNAAVRQLLRGRRRDIDRIASDEEMFI